MYLPSSGDGVDAIVTRRHLRHFITFFIRKADNLVLLRPLLLSSKTLLEFVGSASAEIVPTSDYVGSVGVMGWIEGGEEG